MNYSNFFQFLNATNHSETTVNPVTTIITGFLGFSIIASLLLNGTIVIAYIKDRSLRSNFDILIVNLAIAEVLLAGTGMPGSFIRGLYGYFPFNAGLCTFFQYGINIFGSGMRYGHVLISINRLWAVTFPVHYSRHHNPKWTYGMIAVTWVFVVGMYLSYITPGRIWTVPNDRKCVINVEFQRKTALVVEILGFTAAEVIVIGCSLFILLSLRKRARRTESAAHPDANGASSKIGLPPESVVNTHLSTEMPEIKETTNVNSKQARIKKPRRNGSHNRTLIYLVGAVIVCWTPNHVYWLLVDATGYWNDGFLAVQYFAVYSNSWINPILCYLALDKLRKSINCMLLCAKTKK